jgi:integrase
LYKNKKYKTVIVYLTDEELKQLENHAFSQPRLQQVKDLFIFCCYTGLAYAEMSTLTNKNIEIGFDGKEWIQMKRKKTNRKISVPVLPKAKEILEKYNNELPSISNQQTRTNGRRDYVYATWMVNTFKLFLLAGGRKEEVLSLKWNDIIQGSSGVLFFQFRNLKVE